MRHLPWRRPSIGDQKRKAQETDDVSWAMGKFFFSCLLVLLLTLKYYTSQRQLREGSHDENRSFGPNDQGLTLHLAPVKLNHALGCKYQSSADTADTHCWPQILSKNADFFLQFSALNKCSSYPFHRLIWVHLFQAVIWIEQLCIAKWRIQNYNTEFYMFFCASLCLHMSFPVISSTSCYPYPHILLQ